MSEAKVLSNEEVDALLKVTQEKNTDLSKVIDVDEKSTEQWAELDYTVDNKALEGLIEATYVETEKLLTSFLHKKIAVKGKSVVHAKVADVIKTLEENKEKNRAKRLAAEIAAKERREAELKQAEARQAEAKLAEEKHAQEKQAQAQPAPASDAASAETKAADTPNTTASDAKSTADAKENKTTETKPTENKSAEAQANSPAAAQADAKPVEKSENKPADVKTETASDHAPKEQEVKEDVATIMAKKKEASIYCVMQVAPQNRYCMVVMEMPFLHHAINILYGGALLQNDPVMWSPGKIGIIVAEKLSQVCFDGFIQACKEYGSFTAEPFKIVTLSSLITKLNLDDAVCAIELSIFFGDIETTIALLVNETFLNDIIPKKPKEEFVEKSFWREAIESQVIDSSVTVTVSLPDIAMKMSEVMALKNGGLIPITDPTLVYVSLNNIKLFRGNAGQTNANRVVKILSEI